jgi:tRNA(His) guanylyltransferase
VSDYFRWRQEDAHRNALNAHIYWLLRGEGQPVAKATNALVGMSVAEKNQLLIGRGIDFYTLPAWQKHGSGVIWESYEKVAQNPVTGETVTAARKRLTWNMELPLNETYGEFIQMHLRTALTAG